MITRARPPSLWNPWGRIILIVLTAAVFVLAATFPRFPGDDWVLLRLQALQDPWLTNISTLLAYVGSAKAAIVATIAAVILLWTIKRRVDSLVALLGGLFILAGVGLKLVVDRPRPDYFLITSGPSLSSFPSGHTVFAAIFCGVAIVLINNWVQRPLARRILQNALVMLVLAMAISRIYLGFHWPSDILGSFLYSAVALGELIWIRIRLTKRPDCKTGETLTI